ncbi:MAG: hypothetical protein KF846_10365 [Cyclobacteriaceae bacterium]|nr:hypothetical protein [Cyclobacteriaceae bacterium]
MTKDDYKKLFQDKILIVDDNYYHFYKNDTYSLAKGEDSIDGTYSFKQRGDEVFLITKPPIYPEQGEEVEVTLYLGSHRVVFIKD